MCDLEPFVGESPCGSDEMDNPMFSELMCPSSSAGLRYRRVRSARRTAIAGLALATFAVVATASWLSRPGVRPGRQKAATLQVSQEWAGWGQCDLIETGIAYGFETPWHHHLDNVPSPSECCKYCQNEVTCKSWTWLRLSGECWFKDGEPVRKMSKEGYVSGRVFKRESATSRQDSSALLNDTTSHRLASKSVAASKRAGMRMHKRAGDEVPPAPTGPIAGGRASQYAFTGFLSMWRQLYHANDGSVPEVSESSLPRALRNVSAKIVVSSGGAAGGVVTEGMGYGLMVEGFQAAKGDSAALANGLALMRGWIGMVYGPRHHPHPFGGGNAEESSATNVSSWPYGVSAIENSEAGPSGVAGWKYPVDRCYPLCQGSATDGDEDAVLGMIYLAAALGYPEDFVDVVMRALISFASADLGFPELYRTLPDGSRMFVPKGGSQWGGLLPTQGRFKSTDNAWCYNPSYFAPGHYRLFRDFAEKHWRPSFRTYLPPHLDGTPTSLSELTAAFDGTVTAGYNILYRSSCPSGSVSNWVGVKAECEDKDALSCSGVPWETTPYVGENGTCTASGTTFGSFGPDASRTPWRIAMDYVLYPNQSTNVTMYDRDGAIANGTVFNAQVYLNRLAKQFTQNAECDGGLGKCVNLRTGRTATANLAAAFDQGPHMTCSHVPNPAQSWWAAFMAYPTFTAFVAPLSTLSAEESSTWLDTFASICDFSGGGVRGDICSSTYFELSQEVISSMLMAGAMAPLPAKGAPMPAAAPAPVPATSTKAQAYRSASVPTQASNATSLPAHASTKALALAKAPAMHAREPTEAPAHSKASQPTGAPLPTEAPLSTNASEPAQAPVAATAPQSTEAPASTQAPKPTEATSTTQVHKPREAPTTTQMPKPTEAPAATKAPETTEAPVATMAPKTTEAPVTTMEPETTVAPATTEAPSSTEAPAPAQAPKKEPKPTEAPTTTTTPESTEAPVLAKGLGSTKVPPTTQAPEPPSTDATTMVPETTEAPAATTLPEPTEAPAQTKPSAPEPQPEHAPAPPPSNAVAMFKK